jgi:hypothetical protein
MIRGPDEASTRLAARRTPSRRAWIWACVLLVTVTWTPVLALHLRNMSVADSGAGVKPPASPGPAERPPPVS